MYLGLKKKYNLEHNNIVFAHDYIRSVNSILGKEIPHPDISFYLRDTSKTDPTVAPEGKSTLYILVPVPNKQLAPINWSNQIPKMRKMVLDALKQRIGLKDIEQQIEVEKIITPDDFIKDYNVYNGAVFNLSHKVLQMMWLRPHNKFEEIDNMYLVGGGTHPGSGLPTIYQSGIIAADLINQKYET
jgi:phytoene desaturase